MNEAEQWRRLRARLERLEAGGRVVRKTVEGWVVFSESGKKLSKPYATKKEAADRLREIERIKHAKEQP